MANNSIVMTFLSAPPFMLPIPPPEAKIFDLDAAIRENQLCYIRSLVVHNVTQGPTPRPFGTQRTAPDARSRLPTFSLPAFPLSLPLFHFWLALGEAIGIISMAFITISFAFAQNKRKASLREDLKSIAGKMTVKREGWTKEKEGWEKEKEADIAEKAEDAAQRKLEEERIAEMNLWEGENGHAQRRIVELEEETEWLKAVEGGEQAGTTAR